MLQGEHDEVESTTYLFAMLARGNYYSGAAGAGVSAQRVSGTRVPELHGPRLSRELCVMTAAAALAGAQRSQRLLALLTDTLTEMPMPPGVTLLARRQPA